MWDYIVSIPDHCFSIYIHEYLLVCVCVSFPFHVECDMWDFIVLVFDHYLSSYFFYFLSGIFVHVSCLAIS